MVGLSYSSGNKRVLSSYPKKGRIAHVTRARLSYTPFIDPGLRCRRNASDAIEDSDRLIRTENGMQSTGHVSYAIACFLGEETGTSPMEYVLVASLVAVILGLALLAAQTHK